MYTVLIMGESGSGKSTAIRNLPPEETLVINVLKKPLPFKSTVGYSAEKKNLSTANTYESVIKRISETSAKYIVIDDATYLLRNDYFSFADQSTYARFTQLAKHFKELLSAINNMKKNAILFFVMHLDINYPDKGTPYTDPAVVGKLLLKEYHPADNVTIALISHVSYSENKTPQYEFITNRTQIDGIEYKAKSPFGMFESLTIPNDYYEVVKTIDNFYNLGFVSSNKSSNN